jgi:hypothetical protein
VIGGRTVGEDVALGDLLVFEDADPLVDAGVLVGPLELEQLVGLGPEALVVDGDETTIDGGDDAVASRAARASIPVPMYGASARSNGTA